MKKREKACIICGKMFTPRSSRACLCGSVKCAKARRRLTSANWRGREVSDMDDRKCVVCGKMFTPGNVNQKSCGAMKCKNHLRREALKKRIEKLEKEGERKTCPICGKSFVKKAHNQKTCGDRHCSSLLGGRSRQVERSCAHCGRIFKVDPNAAQRFCTLRCANDNRALQAAIAASSVCPFQDMQTYVAGVDSWLHASMTPMG